MKRVLLGVLALLAIVIVWGSLYTLDERQQAIVTQFGRPIGDAVTEPGLHFKVPLIQNVNRFDKRWLPFDGVASEVPTRDKKFIWVDTYARWRISDPLRYYQSVMGNEEIAQSRLDDIIDGATRTAVANYNLIEIVRSSNRDFEVSQELAYAEQQAAVEIEVGREAIMAEILKKASEVTPDFGVELVDVQFKRINYTDRVRDSVYQRMISERQRIAARSRSEGEGQAAEIRGRKERELQEIQSEAFRTAEEIRGNADAEAAAIYAGAYNRDPDFYQFLKTLETYHSSLDDEVTLLLSSESEFLSFLNSSR